MSQLQAQNIRLSPIEITSTAIATNELKSTDTVEVYTAKDIEKAHVQNIYEFLNKEKNEPDFCPLYAEHKKCHDMESLNCYLCACPNFRFKDAGIEKVDGKTKYSFCGINSKDGKVGVYGDAIHQDCSGCGVPHHKDYVIKHFDLDWKKCMKKVIIS